ncbi:MAG: hypothetical protein ACLQBD_32365 [Syntrophobacteraceae bacterium]
MESILKDSLLSECSGRVVPVICFEEVFERARVVARQGSLSWRKFQALYSIWDSFEVRSDAVYYQDIRERVNLYPELKKFMKSHRADFKYKKTPDGRHLFFKSLTNEVEYGIAFKTIHHMGLGKAFTASFRVEHVKGPYAGCVHFDNVFRIYGEPPGRELCWTYSTNDDLKAVFASVNALWEEIMPILESYFRSYFTKPLLTLPDDIELRGPVTAKEGLPEAESLALLWANDAELNAISSKCHLDIRDELGPATTPNGKLRPHAYWYYSFFSPSRRPETIIVKVPFAGSSSFFNHSFDKFPVDQMAHHFLPLGKTWIDSDRAMTVAEINGGKLARESAMNNFDIHAKLEIPRSNHVRSARWRIEYFLVDNSHRRVDCTLHIDPGTGELIKDAPF